MLPTYVVTRQVQPAATITAAKHQQMAGEAVQRIHTAAPSACSRCARTSALLIPSCLQDRATYSSTVSAAVVRTCCMHACRPQQAAAAQQQAIS